MREAARELHWHPSKAQRCHEAARQHLHELLGVDSLDELEIIVGLAAYVSLAEGARLHLLAAGVEALADNTESWRQHMAGRAPRISPAASRWAAAPNLR